MYNFHHPVPEPFRDDNDCAAMMNFAAYRSAIAKSPEQQSFWYGVFEKFKTNMENKNDRSNKHDHR